MDLETGRGRQLQTAAGQGQQLLYVARMIFPVIGWTVDLHVAGVYLGEQTPSLVPRSRSSPHLGGIP
ncbi:MAG: hypothetical protein ACREOL_03455 [Candidatus Dormibacteria bacterium]